MQHCHGESHGNNLANPDDTVLLHGGINGTDHAIKGRITVMKQMVS